MAGIVAAGLLGQAGVLPDWAVVAVVAAMCVGFVRRITADARRHMEQGARPPASSEPAPRSAGGPPTWIAPLLALPQLGLAAGVVFVMIMVDEPVVYAAATPVVVTSMFSGVMYLTMGFRARRRD